MQKRNFISTSDLAKYVKFYLINSKLFNKFDIVNPIGPETISIKEFAQKCAGYITGINKFECTVEIKSEYKSAISNNDFKYGTLNKKFICTETTDNYLSNIIPMIKTLDHEQI